MPLTEAEKKFVDKLSHIHTDEEIMYEINRIRWECGDKDRGSIDMVRKARYKMGIKRHSGGKKGTKRED